MMDKFRVRLNCIDHYQATPSRYDPPLHKAFRASQASKEPKVPVVRVFGSTETGQKVCAHIHGVFPYLYVDYGGRSLEKAEVGEYIHQFHLSIDHALALSYRQNQHRVQPRYVARITLVKGIPFYGFHVGYRFYLKIYMLSPVVMTRLADLLHQGVIMSRQFQPYEAHLQYLLQFMTDYNLYGCDYIDIDLARVVFRAPVPEHGEEHDSHFVWDDESIPQTSITDDFVELPRVSHCSLEVDICAQDILNRKPIDERPLHHDFIEREQPLPSSLKLVHSMAGLWKDETERRKRRMQDLASGNSPFPPEALVTMSADPRYTQPPGWIHEEEYRNQIQLLVDEEGKKIDHTQISFSNYVRPVPLEDSVKTVHQSVEDLFPENLLPALGLEERLLEANSLPANSVDVDEDALRELEIDQEEQQDFANDTDQEPDQDAEDAEGEENVKGKKSSQDGSGAAEKVDRAIHEQPQQPQKSLHNLQLRPELKRREIKTINGLGNGVAVSGLRSKQRPVIPLSAGLLQDAREKGLISKVGDILRPKTDATVPSKRSLSASEDAIPAKRIRLDGPGTAEAAISGKPEHLDSHDVVKAEAELSTLKADPERSQLSQLSSQKSTPKSSSGKQSGNQTIQFPVVKDPRNLNTKMRLSQQALSQGCQPSDSDLKAKQVSFDPHVTVQEPSVPGEESTPKAASQPNIRTKPVRSADPARSRKLFWTGSSTMFTLKSPPPSSTEVFSTLQTYNLPPVIYQDAFYSEDKDVPPRPREYAGREFRLDGNSLPYLPDFDPTGQSPASYGIKPKLGPDFSKMELAYEEQQRQCSLRSWEIAEPPPSLEEVKTWWSAKTSKQAQQAPDSLKRPPATQGMRTDMSQIIGPTPKNKHGFKYSQKRKSTSVPHEAQYMSTMSLEVHVNTRGKLVPNPEEDEVQCIFWCFGSDEDALHGSQSPDRIQSGIVILSEDLTLGEKIRYQSGVIVDEEDSELDLFTRVVEIVRTHDPDILTGYEVHGGSWGYLMERSRFKYDYDLCDEFSRMKSQSHGRIGKEADRWGFNTTSTIRVTGRHMINIWRAMRGELNLLQYSMENVVWHLLHRRIPHYSWRILTDWYRSGRPKDLNTVLRYYLNRTRMDIDILERSELIARTSEQARVLGVDFFSVFSRGSQFKVESIMFRIAKPENFLLVSPSRKQVGAQNALECLPLVMEPQSAFYTSPVLVLDFQSLYPSVMIAYNYCYSTFLGRIVNWRGTNKMGFTEYKRREGLLRLLQDHINIAPNGIMYTRPSIRKSLLAKMLTEILETRVMVKSGMKQDKDDKTLQQLLNNRQLALKLLANVTYGYTSASFSGRMPCSEIADSIVQTGRETLERAIAYIHSVPRWGAEVVYGDTDSLFVHLPGRTRQQAFELGAEMAAAITHMNPRPVKLKFEKVYHPCVLLAKKRYVGYKFESPGQEAPEFDAKGIETVRRDGTPAEQKIEEKALRILFDTADLSQVKRYFQRECAKIMRGAVSVKDFCFAREVKLGTYAVGRPGGLMPAGAMISARKMQEDARAEPQYGERVPYVVIAGAPGARLVDRCVAPEELLNDPFASLDSEYYIGKNLIPPLERIFNLVGANVSGWYDEMTKVQMVRVGDGNGGGGGFAELFGGAGGQGGGGGGGGGGGQAVGGKKTLEWFLRSASCAVCGVKIKTGTRFQTTTTTTTDDRGEVLPLCRVCAADTGRSMVQLQTRLNQEARRLADVVKVCQSCAALAPLDEVECDSKDCPVFYTRVKQGARLAAEKGLVEPLVDMLGELDIARYEMGLKKREEGTGEALDW